MVFSFFRKKYFKELHKRKWTILISLNLRAISQSFLKPLLRQRHGNLREKHMHYVADDPVVPKRIFRGFADRSQKALSSGIPGAKGREKNQESASRPATRREHETESWPVYFALYDSLNTGLKAHVCIRNSLPMYIPANTCIHTHKHVYMPSQACNAIPRRPECS